MNPTETPASLEEWFQRYSSLVYRVCRRYVKNPEDAEDLTQEIFLKLSMRRGEFRGDASPSTWLYRIAVNACLDCLRKQKARDAQVVEALDERVVDHLSRSGNDVLARIDLERILRTVKPRTREALFLVLAEGLSYAEAGEVMGMEKSAVAKQVTRFLASRRPKSQAVAAAPWTALVHLLLPWAVEWK